jgi:hypothetical protein
MQQLWSERAQQQEQAAAVAAAAATVPHVSHPALPKLRQPSLFKGIDTGFAVDDWIGELEQQFAYYVASFVTSASRIAFAVAHLAGPAALWWKSLPPADKSAIATWNEFVARLHSRFRPVQGAMLARQRLGKLLQRPGQSVSQFAHSFQITLTPITDMGHADQVHHFVNELLPHIASKVWERHPTVLPEAIDFAVSVEAMGSFGRAASHHAFQQHTSRTYASTSSTSAPMDINNVQTESVDEFDSAYAPADSVSAPANPTAAAPATDAMQTILAQMQSMQQTINALQQRNAAPRNNETRGLVPGLKHDAIERLRSEGRCFRCKQKGHMKSECKNPVNQSSNW